VVAVCGQVSPGRCIVSLGGGHFVLFVEGRVDLLLSEPFVIVVIVGVGGVLFLVFVIVVGGGYMALGLEAGSGHGEVGGKGRGRGRLRIYLSDYMDFI
jgi:hypothetical protein